MLSFKIFGMGLFVPCLIICIVSVILSYKYPTEYNIKMKYVCCYYVAGLLGLSIFFLGR